MCDDLGTRGKRGHPGSSQRVDTNRQRFQRSPNPKAKYSDQGMEKTDVNGDGCVSAEDEERMEVFRQGSIANGYPGRSGSYSDASVNQGSRHHVRREEDGFWNRSHHSPYRGRHRGPSFNKWRYQKKYLKPEKQFEDSCGHFDDDVLSHGNKEVALHAEFIGQNALRRSPTEAQFGGKNPRKPIPISWGKLNYAEPKVPPNSVLRDRGVVMPSFHMPQLYFDGRDLVPITEFSRFFGPCYFDHSIPAGVVPPQALPAQYQFTQPAFMFTPAFYAHVPPPIPPPSGMPLPASQPSEALQPPRTESATVSQADTGPQPVHTLPDGIPPALPLGLLPETMQNMAGPAYITLDVPYKNREVTLKSEVLNPDNVEAKDEPVRLSDIQRMMQEIHSVLPTEAEVRRFTKMSKDIWTLYVENRQSMKSGFFKLRLQDDIEGMLRRHMGRFFPEGLRVMLVGSSITGFGLESSDADMCLLVSNCEVDQRFRAPRILADVLKVFLTAGDDYGLRLIGYVPAKVPLVKFTDGNSSMEVDLNCNNAVGLLNTRLMYAYGSMDWRVKPLVVIVKLWAQKHGINDAKNMSISSYSLVLMVIHYLQVGVKPAILPRLQQLAPEKFDTTIGTDDTYDVNLEELRALITTKNNLTLGHLFLGFLDYYANRFNFKKSAISVRLGKTLPVEECKYRKDGFYDPCSWNFLCIEEPFLLTNTASSVFDPLTFDRIIAVFRASHVALSRTRDVNSVLDPKLVPPLKRNQLEKNPIPASRLTSLFGPRAGTKPMRMSPQKARTPLPRAIPRPIPIVDPKQIPLVIPPPVTSASPEQAATDSPSSTPKRCLTPNESSDGD